jgi:uncharacterized protein (TIGR03086 family)
MDVSTLHARTVADFGARVAAVGAERWGGRTPCTEWSVRELVNHVVGEDRWTPPLVEGRTIAEVGDSLDGDLLGDDPASAARAAGDAAVASLAAGVAAGATVHLSYGDEDVVEYAHQLAADHLIHGWDLAVATGGDPSLDPDLVAAVAAWFADREELYRGAGVVAARVDAAADDPQSALLAAFGRDPAWRPPVD